LVLECASGDFDADGWQDIYFVNGRDLYNRGISARNALYHNNRDGTFTDVTEAAQVPGTGYGLGCIWGDYDNDGFPDLFVTEYGRNVLYHNNGNGTFTDVTEKAGVGGGGYGMGVAVGDYNADGFPDLYVTQYGRSILYRNNGDGTFTDVAATAGVAAPGWASSAGWFDYDNDGRLDLFVCRFVDFSKLKHHKCSAPNVPALAGKA